MLTHAHCHMESSAHHAYNGNQQSLAGGPPLTGSASDGSSFCPRVLFSSAPALLGAAENENDSSLLGRYEWIPCYPRNSPWGRWRP